MQNKDFDKQSKEYLGSDIVRPILEDRLIVSIAALHPGNEGSCMPLSLAVKTIAASKTHAIVYHVPDPNSLDDLSAYTWSIYDLLNELPPNRYVLLANTNRAKSAQEAVKRARNSRDIFKSLPHTPDQDEPIIKLEVLNDELESDDEAVLSATDTLINKDGLVVLPLISRNEQSVRSCFDLGAPFVRVLSGQINSMTGIKGASELKNLVRRVPGPLFFEGGFGTLPHVRNALDIGATGILMNAAFRRCENPELFAQQVRNIIDTDSKIRQPSMTI
jgi:thiazole synthase ThiGH ThiG subunit